MSRTVEIILLERVPGLGQIGDIVQVKTGYARNYLLPQQKALHATPQHQEEFQQRKTQIEADNLRKKTDAEAVAKRMDDLVLTLIRSASEMGQLYGAVRSRNIAESLTEKGFTTHRSQVTLDYPIKTLGVFPCTIRLHPEVLHRVLVNVAKSDDEAATQLERHRKGLSAVPAQKNARADALEGEAEDSVEATEGAEGAEAVEALDSAGKTQAAADETSTANASQAHEAEHEAGADDKPDDGAS